MTGSTPSITSDRLYHLLSEHAARANSLHRQFLQTRQTGLAGLARLIAAQMQAAAGADAAAPTEAPAPAAAPAPTAAPAPVDAPAPTAAPAPAGPADQTVVFSARQLDAFGVGAMSDCFGPRYAHYDARPLPRIPNGALKMMTRITEITGCPGDFQSPAAVTADYDVPADPWYLGGRSAEIPLALWMEIALQPCGFLSAFLDSYALMPAGERFLFRNLDGDARLLARFDPRGQTITTRARLLSSTAGASTVIQRYSFQLSCAGQTVYQGQSTFGYFTAEAMANQQGLDGGRPTPPALAADPVLAQSAVRLELNRRRPAPLDFLDAVQVVRGGGRWGAGYLYAERPVNPADWFYPCHFYQDPVMPGSLGVEAALEAMRAYAAAYLGGQPARDHLILGDPAMVWRYRGQITPQNRLMALEVHLHPAVPTPGGQLLRGDASLWVDGLRIYEVKNMGLAL